MLKKYHWFGWCTISQNVIVIITSIYYFRQIFTNLCIFNKCSIEWKEQPWIDYNFEPSWIAKMSALTVPIIFILIGISWCILSIQYIHPFLPYDLWFKLIIIPASLLLFVYFVYYLFITSTLRSFRNKEVMFKQMISSSLFYFVRLLIVINLAIFITKEIIYYRHKHRKYIDNIPYLMYYLISNAILNILIECSLLYAYYKGYDNIALWFHEHHIHDPLLNNNDENDKVHEIYKIISKCTAAMIVSLICNIFLILFDIWHYYGMDANNTHDVQTYLSMGAEIVWNILVIINTLTYLWTVYFIFPFGQKHYDNTLCCDSKIYRCCVQKHKVEYNQGSRCKQKISCKGSIN